MNDPIASGSPEAQPRASFEQRAAADAKAVAIDVEDAVKRAVAGIECWYAEHVHAVALAQQTPLSTSERSRLLASVTASINTRKE